MHFFIISTLLLRLIEIKQFDMKRIQFYLFFISLIALKLSAQTTVYCPEVGTISTAIDALNINKDTITFLQVSGNIDARDFKKLKSYTQLRSIDMSKAMIYAYTGFEGTSNAKFIDGVSVPIEYFANEIPEYGIGGGIERFVFPDSVKKISDYSFSNLGIKEIIFPPRLERIGNYAFRNCNALNSPLIFPKTLQFIGNSPFMYCTNIPKITFDKQSPYFVVDDKDVVYSSNLDTLLFFPPYYKGKYKMNPKIKILPNDVVRGVAGLTAIAFPDSLEYLGARSFEDCSNLRWIDFKNATTFTNHAKKTAPMNTFAACHIDTMYVSCRQRPATNLVVILLGSGIKDSKVFVPLDSVEVFKKDSLWQEFPNVYGVETMPTSLDKPEITSFRISNVAQQSSDTTFSSVTFEFHGNNISQYFLSDQSLANNTNKSYTINNDTSLFMVLNLDRRYDKKFVMYGTDICGNKSETREILIRADIFNSVSNELADKIQIFVSNGNSLNIINLSNLVFTVKVYNVLGNCIVNEKVLSGKNIYNMTNAGGVYLVSVEKNIKRMILQKIIVK